MDLYELLSRPVGFDLDERGWAARCEAEIRADERARIVEEIGQMARDAQTVQRYQRAGALITCAQKVKKGPKP